MASGRRWSFPSISCRFAEARTGGDGDRVDLFVVLLGVMEYVLSDKTDAGSLYRPALRTWDLETARQADFALAVNASVTAARRSGSDVPVLWAWTAR